MTEEMKNGNHQERRLALKLKTWLFALVVAALLVLRFVTAPPRAQV